MSVPPYIYLMPSKVRDQMPGLAYLASAELARGLDSDVDVKHFMLECKKHFEILDSDLSGEVELEELIQLLTEVTPQPSLSFSVIILHHC